MGASITLKRRFHFQGDYAHVLKGKIHLFRIVKRQDDKFDLLRKNGLPLVKGMDLDTLNEKIGAFKGARVEFNESDIVLR